MKIAKAYHFDDEMYLVTVLNGLAYSTSVLDNTKMIYEFQPLIVLFKSINVSNVRTVYTKGSELEKKYFNRISAAIHSFSLTYGFYQEIVTCAYRSNDKMTAYNIYGLLQSRLINSRSGLENYELIELIERKFDENVVVTRQLLDEFTKYVLEIKHENS